MRSFDIKNTTSFTLPLLNSLHQILKSIREISKEELIHVCEEERWYVSLQTFIDELLLRATNDRFLRVLPQEATLPTQSIRNKFKMKKLFDSGELGLGKNSYRGRPSFALIFFLLADEEKINAKNYLAKNPSRFLYQPWKTNIVASEIPKINPTIRYFLPLTLKLARNQLYTSNSKMPRQSQQGTLIEFLSRIILAQGLSHMAIKVIRCDKYNVELFNYYSSRWHKLERFSNLLTNVVHISLNYRWL